MTDEPQWYRQIGLACEYCGAPGHLIAIAPPISVVFTTDADALSAPTLETRVTCPEHRVLVKNRADRMVNEAHFAERVHGRPILGDETYPERMKRSMATILRRLNGWDGPEDGRVGSALGSEPGPNDASTAR